METIPLQFVTKEAFAPYGVVLAFAEGSHHPFEVLVEEKSQPWRLALYRYSNRSIARMECHTGSMESFEPLEGATVLLVAAHDTPEKQAAFYLDKPVCLHAGTWHQTLALTPEASVKITENLQVGADFYDLEQPLRVGMTT